MTEGTETTRLLIGRMDDLAASLREVRATQTVGQEAQHKIALSIERISARLEGVTQLDKRVEDIEDVLAITEVRLKILEQPGVEITGKHDERIDKLEKVYVRVGGGIAVLVILATIGRELIRVLYK